MDDGNDELSEAGVDLDLLELLNSRSGDGTKTVDMLGLGRRHGRSQLAKQQAQEEEQTDGMSGTAEHERAALRAIVRALQVCF